MENRRDKWDKLKEYLEEMILDSKKYGSKYARPYSDIKKLMELIENDTDAGVYPDNCIWKRHLLNGDSINISGEMIFYKHGSEDSIDNDVIYILDKMPEDKEVCRKFCAEDESENRNIAVIKDGVVVSCFKGTPDEINNALLDTYELHEQQFPLLVKCRVKRNKTIKIIRAMRIVLSHISRSQYRDEVKSALRNGWGSKLECLSTVDLNEIDYSKLNKKMSREDVLKTIAFQMGQTYALIHLGKECYTKREVAEVCPELRQFLYRDPNSNVNDLEVFKRYFLVAIANMKLIWDDKKQTLSDTEHTYDVINEIEIE